MESIYVISTKKRAKKNKYKIGRHTGTIRELESRYVTALINPIVYHFYPTKNTKQVEDQVKIILDRYRIKNKHENKLEWFRLDINIIRKTINEIVDQYKLIHIE